MGRSGSIRLWLPLRCCRRSERALVRFSYEGLIIIVCTLVGIVGELTWGDWQLVARDGHGHHAHFVHLNNFEHATMFSLFFIVGLITVIDSMVSSSLQFPVGIDRLALALAYAVEGLLFFYHLDGRPGMDVRLHELLIYAILGCVGAVLLEIAFPTSLLCIIARSFCSLLQGSWFFQIAHVLYGSSPWEETDENSGFVVLAFCWHILGISMGSLVLFLCVSCVVSKCCDHRAASRNGWTKKECKEEESPMLQLQDRQEESSTV